MFTSVASLRALATVPSVEQTLRKSSYAAQSRWSAKYYDQEDECKVN